MGSKPEQADPLKSPQFVGMRPVGGLRGGLRESAILGLEIAVDDPRGVQRMHGARDLTPKHHHIAPRHRPAREPCRQRLAFEVLERHIRLAVWRLADVDRTHDERVLEVAAKNGLS